MNTEVGMNNGTNIEFLDELGKIFNAVVAYQKKSTEFNERFISPWIHLGNVFENQDRGEQAISSLQKSIQNEPQNAGNWFELGNQQFRLKHFTAAADSFAKAIAINAGDGWSYSNLALALASQGKYEQAIPLYKKAITLLAADPDKAVAWNRLGNAYRRMGQYNEALDAFHNADQLDVQNAGFRDNLDELGGNPSVVQQRAGQTAGTNTPLDVSPIELIVAESRAAEAAAQHPAVPAMPAIAGSSFPASEIATAADRAASDAAGFNAFDGTDATPVQPPTEDLGAELTANEGSAPQWALEDTRPMSAVQADDQPIGIQEADTTSFTDPTESFSAAAEVPALPSGVAETIASTGSSEPAATIAPSGDVQIEMDTKNAHTWNELGNVYYNKNQFDDAIVAYSKAIELDRWFAWPYSNLALAYVQKNRFVEAILLYQRSIELFESDKDKAISWNRLGNVYRRLNDYDNAISAYQRADNLDPDNATLSLQSRFSLLGSVAAEKQLSPA